jgi:hypothetical protein
MFKSKKKQQKARVLARVKAEELKKVGGAMPMAPSLCTDIGSSGYDWHTATLNTCDQD